MSFTESEQLFKTNHSLPLGAVVIYENDDGDKARLVVVQHSRDCDGTPLYMVGKNSIIPPDNTYKMYSRGYLAYRLNVGWFEGNVPRSMLRYTGETVSLKEFDIDRYK